MTEASSRHTGPKHVGKVLVSQGCLGMADLLGQKVLSDSGGRQLHIIHGFESWCDLGRERLE